VERYNTALHEAAHAVTDTVLGIKVGYATIDPDDDSRGHVWSYFDPRVIDAKNRRSCGNDPWLREGVTRYGVGLMAGPAADLLWHWDADATPNWRSYVEAHDLDGHNDLAGTVRSAVAVTEGDQWAEYVVAMLVFAGWIVDEYQPEVVAVAEQLLDRRRLTGHQVRAIVTGLLLAADCHATCVGIQIRNSLLATAA
jgi:hypothetical protein